MAKKTCITVAKVKHLFPNCFSKPPKPSETRPSLREAKILSKANVYNLYVFSTHLGDCWGWLELMGWPPLEARLLLTSSSRWRSAVDSLPPASKAWPCFSLLSRFLRSFSSRSAGSRFRPNGNIFSDFLKKTLPFQFTQFFDTCCVKSGIFRQKAAQTDFARKRGQTVSRLNLHSTDKSEICTLLY